MQKINVVDQYRDIVAKYGKRGCSSNDYIQNEAADLIDHGMLFAICGEKNAFLLVKKSGFYRVYYYINDFDEDVIFEKDEYVTEILFRGSIGEPVQQIEYLNKCGFKRNLVRDQYYAKYSSLNPPKKLNNVFITPTTTVEQATWAVELFNASFDKWSGDYIPSEKIEILYREKSILVATDTNGALLGALQLEKKQGSTWLNHIAIVPESRGKGIGKGLVDAFIENGHIDDNSRYFLWVQQQNTPAVKLYQNKGFTYCNKSTISMIKL